MVWFSDQPTPLASQAEHDLPVWLFFFSFLFFLTHHPSIKDESVIQNVDFTLIRKDNKEWDSLYLSSTFQNKVTACFEEPPLKWNWGDATLFCRACEWSFRRILDELEMSESLLIEVTPDRRADCLVSSSNRQLYRYLEKRRFDSDAINILSPFVLVSLISSYVLQRIGRCRHRLWHHKTGQCIIIFHSVLSFSVLFWINSTGTTEIHILDNQVLNPQTVNDQPSSTHFSPANLMLRPSQQRKGSDSM